MADRLPRQFRWNYDIAELWADGVVHVVGVIFAVIGAVILIAFSINADPPVLSVAAIVYASSLVAAISVSAIYNIWPVTPTKWFLRRFDHAMIYLLIAGTYTPFTIKMGPQSWPLLAAIWTIAIIGILLKLFLPGRFDRLSILLYLALGWSGVLVYDAMTTSLSPTVVRLIAAGGIVYSLGVIFHVWERLRFQNAIWHGFVVTGAALHYCAVFYSISMS
ncbi:hemolysin III family protein [Phyllobacterium salinisoli]|uniref:Hemolysin III family protein n=1 Tax=Phyllobacterium salinisoli TaxID=1899321 RepID=A0A368K6G8_9HYPH|nr:hemolysin III family protein [Phyllobacterium salinisoli]RCS24949.1 hemolysin III family protein [Phyllobacterium salinisoli]